MEATKASSNLINLHEFIGSRLPLIREDYFGRNKNLAECVKYDMQLPLPAIERLADMCDPIHLNETEEQMNISNLNEIDSEHLSILDFVKTNFDKHLKRNHPYEIKFAKNLYKLNEIDPPPEDTIKTPDVILTVQISQALNSKLSKLAWSEDFVILGQNKLTDLKDKISCFREEIRLGEFSENPDSISEASRIKDHIKSGYFFIEDTLYNDTREDRADCSIPVIKWGIEKEIGHFKTMPMEDSRFIDLSIRLGFPYLYKHVGNCEHLIVFTSVKLVNPSSDCYILSKYPIPRDKTRGRFTFCWCCNRLYAKWVVCGSKYAVDDPTFLCQRCFKNTHYEEISAGEDGAKSAIEVKSEEPESLESFERVNPKLRRLFDFKAYHFSQL